MYLQILVDIHILVHLHDGNMQRFRRSDFHIFRATTDSNATTNMEHVSIPTSLKIVPKEIKVGGKEPATTAHYQKYPYENEWKFDYKLALRKI